MVVDRYPDREIYVDISTLLFLQFLYLHCHWSSNSGQEVDCTYYTTIIFPLPPLRREGCPKARGFHLLLFALLWCIPCTYTFEGAASQWITLYIQCINLIGSATSLSTLMSLCWLVCRSVGWLVGLSLFPKNVGKLHFQRSIQSTCFLIIQFEDRYVGWLWLVGRSVIIS